MPWFKVDDTLHSHPKTRRAGPAAMGMWVLAGSYSAAYTTEGFIADWWVAGFPQGKRRSTELVTAGFWVPGEKNGECGWWFHDWLKYQPSKAEIDADRAMAAARQKRWRQKNRDAASGRFGPDSNGVTDGVTNAEVTPLVTPPVTNATPSRPVPSRPTKALKTRVETSASIVQERNARAADG